MCEGITIGSREVIGEIDGDGNKYLDIMKRSDIFQKQVKRSVKTEYFKSVRSTLKSKLNAGNVFQAINIWDAPNEEKEELQLMDRKTRKLITVYGGLHRLPYTDRLYIPTSDGGRVLVSVKDCVKEEKCSQAKYATQSKETLVKTAATEFNLQKYIANVSKKEKKEN